MSLKKAKKTYSSIKTFDQRCNLISELVTNEILFNNLHDEINELRDFIECEMKSLQNQLRRTKKKLINELALKENNDP
jgi:protein subunit release factor A